MTTTTHDPVAVEIHRRALEAITNEMAITLTRTSGSPVIYDVQDFATSLLDTNGEQLSLSATILFHAGSSLMGTRAIIDTVGKGQVRPGDGWIVNDPFTGGAMHQADIAIITPLFYQNKHVAWAFSNVHVMDTGGSGISGFAPTARSIVEEGLRFPPTKIIRNGAIDSEWERYIAANVRIPQLVLNDLRSMIAANNVSQTKLTDTIDRFGLEKFQQYCEINKQLSEDALRARIEKLPDGVYETTDWVEYDGHGRAELLAMNCRLEIAGSDLHFTFTGEPQIDAFVNGTPGLVHGCLMATVMTTLCYGDVPFNAGIWRPISIDQSEVGTIVNATPPAPVTAAHIQVGARVTKTVKEVLNLAFGASEHAELRGRVGGQAWDSSVLAPLAGTGHGGAPTIVFFMDGVSGGGGGAQTQFDGLDVYGMTIGPGVGMPSVEINESQQPTLYLWRRLNQNSGGPGLHRGGQSLEFVWALYDTDGVAGALTVTCAEMPPRGAGGGLPADTGTWKTYHNTNVMAGMAAGHNVLEDSLTGDQPFRPSNQGGIELSPGDVVRMRCGGGGGLGDPLLRAPDQVAQDARDGYLSAAHARLAYGVVLDKDGAADLSATTERRRAIRRDRLGAEPALAQHRPETVGISVCYDRDLRTWFCGYCRTELGDAADNWRKRTPSAVQPLAQRFAELGMFVRARADDPQVLISESYCPSCAGLLVVDVYPEGFAGYRSPVLANATA
jgi:N-methylhydantoinase B